MTPEAAIAAAHKAFLLELVMRKGEIGASSLALLAALEAAAPHIERALTGRLLEAGWYEPEKPYIA